LGAIVHASQEGVPIYEQEAYDLITLDPSAGGTTLKVLPLPFPNRRVPDPLPKTGNLQFRLVEEPDVIYEVPWASVASIQLFHDLVLSEAKRLAESQRFEEAFEHFVYLFENDPDLPGLAAAYNEFLLREAHWHQAAGRHDRALALLTTLHSRQRDYPGLAEALGQSYDYQLTQAVEAGNFYAARRTLQTLEELMPGHPVAKSWQDKLIALAREKLEEARQDVAQKAYSQAHRKTRRALEIWPRLEEGVQLLGELQRVYPRVIVGVTEPIPLSQPQFFSDWPSRRTQRLVARTLFEFAGPGLEGGRYESPFGEGSWDPVRLRLTLHLRRSEPGKAGGADLTAPQLASLLVQFSAEPTSLSQWWSRLLAGFNLPDLYTLEIKLAQPHLRPEALLVIPVGTASPAVISDHLAAPNPENGHSEGGTSAVSPALLSWLQPNWQGPYTLVEYSSDMAIFRAKPGYFGLQEGQPLEVVEVRFSSAGEAIRALRTGQIDVLDRVPPWMVEELAGVQGLVVEPYALPLLHCVIPNWNRPLLRRSSFRRALMYGIDREAIFRRLVGNTQHEGSRLVSGPFLASTGHGDPVDYAYDSGISPKPYDPRLAIALLQVAFAEWTAELPEESRPDRIPELVLAYRPGPVASAACEALRDGWRRLGLRVRLRALDGPPPAAVPDDVDLLYAEIAIWEPVIDAERLFGPTGLAGNTTPHMLQAIYRLRALRDWNEAAAQLRRIHRLVDLQCNILPLWQLMDYLVRPQTLQGVGSRPITLYQNIENWRVTPRPIQFDL
jgi:ABC-type transport system substrate-binding protein